MFLLFTLHESASHEGTHEFHKSLLGFPLSCDHIHQSVCANEIQTLVDSFRTPSLTRTLICDAFLFPLIY